ncbi:MAG: hypothetical protein RBU21_03160 [FCB group bacterium]|jgi:hypothetical protein|nr:hypothetical protein [FCB group bacterium]
MSVRIHVAAAYEVDSQQFSAALEKAGGANAQQSGPWTWLQASVWGVDGAIIDGGLASLRVPAFRMTTVDGALWYLHLFHQGEEQFALTHFFNFLRPVDPEHIGRKKFLTWLKDYEDYGITVSKELSRELKDLPFDEARRRFVETQARDLCDAFVAVGIPFDREALTAVLTGDSVTDEELDWDIGDLPRFLDELGMPEVVPGWREEVESASAEADSAEAEEEYTPAFTRELIEQWEGDPPEPVEGGPLEYPITGLHQICRIAWFCEEDVEAAARVTYPQGALPAVDFSAAQYAHGWPDEETLLVGSKLNGGKWDTLMWTEEAGKFLRDLPDGSVLELFTASEYDIGRHRYCGPVNGGVWRIEAVSPPASREALEAAHDLSRYVDDTGPLKARSPEDAQAIADTAARLHMLGEPGIKKPQIKGASLHLRGKDLYYERSYLALTAFRRWFADVWDTSVVQADLEESDQKWDEMIASVGKAFEAAVDAAIPKGAVVLKGKAAVWHTIERGADGVSDSIRETDEAFADLGLRCLGDMTCSAVPGIQIRGYAVDDGTTVGVLMLSPMGEYHDLVTYFEDGAVMTTTTTPNAHDDPDRKLFKKHFKGADLKKMHANHIDHCEKLRAEHGLPRALPTSLQGLAETMDEYLVRIGHGG